MGHAEDFHGDQFTTLERLWDKVCNIISTQYWMALSLIPPLQQNRPTSTPLGKIITISNCLSTVSPRKDTGYKSILQKEQQKMLSAAPLFKCGWVLIILVIWFSSYSFEVLLFMCCCFVHLVFYFDYDIDCMCAWKESACGVCEICMRCVWRLCVCVTGEYMWCVWDMCEVCMKSVCVCVTGECMWCVWDKCEVCMKTVCVRDRRVHVVCVRYVWGVYEDCVCVRDRGACGVCEICMRCVWRVCVCMTGECMWCVWDMYEVCLRCVCREQSLLVSQACLPLWRFSSPSHGIWVQRTVYLVCFLQGPAVSLAGVLPLLGPPPREPRGLIQFPLGPGMWAGVSRAGGLFRSAASGVPTWPGGWVSCPYSL